MMASGGISSGIESFSERVEKFEDPLLPKLPGFVGRKLFPGLKIFNEDEYDFLLFQKRSPYLPDFLFKFI